MCVCIRFSFSPLIIISFKISCSFSLSSFLIRTLILINKAFLILFKIRNKQQQKIKYLKTKLYSPLLLPFLSTIIYLYSHSFYSFICSLIY